MTLKLSLARQSRVPATALVSLGQLSVEWIDVEGFVNAGLQRVGGFLSGIVMKLTLLWGTSSFCGKL